MNIEQVFELLLAAMINTIDQAKNAGRTKAEVQGWVEDFIQNDKPFNDTRKQMWGDKMDDPKYVFKADQYQAKMREILLHIVDEVYD